MATGRPWVRLLSCNPAELKDPLVAPFSSGYPAADRSAWPAFLEEVRRTHGELWADFDAFCREAGAGGLAWGDDGPDFMHESPYLNLYAYPAEADYARANALGPTWHRLDSTVRAADTTWALPEPLASRPGALIYLSLGLAGLGRRGADAAAGRPAGPHGAPRDRVQGPARATRSRSTTT